MCVEDDPDIRMILELALTKIGQYEVCMCDGGQRALDNAPAFMPDIVLLDVMMPGITGPQTLAALREQPGMKGVPVVFLTAKAMPNEVEELLSFGATGVILKPLDMVTLSHDIRIYWELGRDIFKG
jgi:CheY-like chemotaxis protein